MGFSIWKKGSFDKLSTIFGSSCWVISFLKHKILIQEADAYTKHSNRMSLSKGSLFRLWLRWFSSLKAIPFLIFSAIIMPAIKWKLCKPQVNVLQKAKSLERFCHFMDSLFHNFKPTQEINGRFLLLNSLRSTSKVDFLQVSKLLQTSK